MRRLKNIIKFEGKGLHTGENSIVEVQPYERGYIFVKDGLEIPATYENVVDTHRNVSIGKNGVEIKTVEHLLSALYGLRVEGAKIIVYGPEIPALDGSSKIFSEEIIENSEEIGGKVYNLKYPLEYENDGCKIMALPY
ncbi:MAG: UDP-3-O-acyl-N-acetylglucosamine deacetylase, partial [candidate division WOR-3 bacterium]